MQMRCFPLCPMFLNFRRLQLRRSQLRKWLVLLWVASITLCLWISGFSAQQRLAQANDLPALVQSGVDAYGAGNYREAIATWQQALDQVEADNLADQSILLENLARAHRQTGQFSEEIRHWEQVIQRHEDLGDLTALGRAVTEQAQAYNHLGQHRRALALLCGEAVSGEAISDTNSCSMSSALHIAQATTDTIGEVAALGSLGETYRLTGDYDQAIITLQQSLAIVGDGNPQFQAAILNSLGNTYGALAEVSRRRARALAQRGDSRGETVLMAEADNQTQQAIDFLQRSNGVASQAVDAQVRAQLNLIPLYQRLNQTEAAADAMKTVQQLMISLPASQDKAFAILTLASYLDQDSQTCPNQTAAQIQLLNEAITIAKTIASPRSESFALGQLGNLYERCNDYPKALELTQKARLIADQDRSSQDSLYLWAWQQGRILQAQGKSTAAVAAYTQALKTLDAIRSDILNANKELQFDFRDRVEPIYREFAALNLNEVPTSVPIASKNKAVDQVLDTLDSLKLAELQNYFANDCVIVAGETRVDTVSEQSATAVISTVIWKNRTAVIASFPDGQQQVEWINLDEQRLTDEINTFRIGLESGRFLTRRNNYVAPSQKLYDLLVRPFEAKLDALQINSLVFINDGILRSVPMAALSDGQQFLIEKYALATTPSLTLTDPNALNRNNLNALILGLSEESSVGNVFFPPLGKVKEEVINVNAQFPDSKILENMAFSEDNMRQALAENSYNILHIATHGVFGAAPEDNYIVTGQKLDNKSNKVITISELDNLIRSVTSVDQEPIDLLTLTACETAIGDNRATLGLAGVAIRAGVRSAIASLWAVDDAATANLITRFYSYLSDPNISKADALRSAQIEVIQSEGFNQHPYYWAPFILIGNWL